MTSAATDLAHALRASRWPAYGLAVLVILLDQWTKDLAVEHLASPAHPLIVAADGVADAKTLLATRGVTAEEVADAIRRRMLWSYRPVKHLTAGQRIGEAEVPRQLILVAGTGHPAPRRIRLLERDRHSTLGELLAERAHIAPAAVTGVLESGALAAGRPLMSADMRLGSGEYVALMSREVGVIDGFMKFVYAENPGAAWGFMRDASVSFRLAFFSAVAALAALGMFWAIWTGWMGTALGTISLGAVLGGAIGNLIDRARYQVVVDFVLNYVGDFRWPVYNVADVGISVGVGLILLELFLQRGARTPPAKED